MTNNPLLLAAIMMIGVAAWEAGKVTTRIRHVWMQTAVSAPGAIANMEISHRGDHVILRMCPLDQSQHGLAEAERALWQGARSWLGRSAHSMVREVTVSGRKGADVWLALSIDLPDGATVGGRE